MRATQAFIEATGGPEVIQWREVDLPAPGPGEVLIRHEAVGLNYIDTYFRTGLYPAAMPSGLGMEAAGVVEAVGEGVQHLKPGQRAVTFGAIGAYATARIAPALQYLPFPDSVDSQTAAAVFLKGATVEALAERCAPLAAGEWALVPAAAGGVGQLLVQWLKARGVRVIGTVGSEEKMALATAAGAETVFLSNDPELTAKVRAATGGSGVAVSYDGVGAATWEASLGSVRRRGTIVSFGNASGPVTGVNLGVLAAHGSLFVTRMTLFDYYREPVEAMAGAAKLWDMIVSGKLSVQIGQTYPLTEAAQAHRDLEARKTTGSTLLLP
ncbi:MULTISPECIES: quinone oxidoreductase [unclassified Novosphingobium]|uniref:quinone oxidoreductase family protein n=1 Tax=unclassified Novosphingobium TaxID=2644732 RepID=UPI000EDE011C|nr:MULTISPECIES: quinone oxidoreductase [unclassified Novosphingobium]HCF24310.1 quinone oxidoreductase [Novosphingobium sp.]HQV04872.1 quinone oxidoreductase [Novosphingobium sp.]